VQKEKEQGA